MDGDTEKAMENESVFKPPAPPIAPAPMVENISATPAENKTATCEDGPTIPYAAPSWACEPLKTEGMCHLEVIKNGVVIENIPLAGLRNQSYLSIGRFKPCDIQLDHPSVSRYHCILQYGQLMTQDPRWFLYDLGSTHGTRLNKKPVKKHCYQELKPGWVFQVADSSRVFSFCGAVNEKELEEEEEAVREARRPLRGPLPNPEAWEEDDEEEEETAAGEDEAKQYKLYYERDPVGWLEKYFEREGIPLRFQYTKGEDNTASEGSEGLKPKKRGGRVGPDIDWTCSIELPDESGGTTAVTLIKASAFTRKLARAHCALLACERLEACGLLRTYSVWNARRKYEDNDFYDSDEDTFLDRTGQIEEQRKKRMRRVEAYGITGERAQTFEELSSKLAEAENKLNIVCSELARMMGKNVYSDSEGKISSSTNFSTRMALSQLRSKEKKLVAEVDQLKKLVELARPSTLEKALPIKNPSSSTSLRKKSPPAFGKSGGEKVANAEPESYEDRAESTHELHGPADSSTAEPPDTGTVESILDQLPSVKEKSRHLLASQATAEFLLPKYGILTKEEARIKQPRRIKRKHGAEESNEHCAGGEVKDDYSDISADGDYATWLPPDNQAGDGKTTLNEKFRGRY